MLKEIFSAVRDGRGLFYDLLVLGAGGLLVCATAARIAMHAHAMPPATQPAVTQASPILVGCRVHAGQVMSGEHLREGGLRAGRVAHERPNCLSLFDTSLFATATPAKAADYILTAQLHPFTSGCR